MAAPLTQIQLLKLTHKQEKDLIGYLWVGNDGWTYSPQLTDEQVAMRWPVTNGLRPVELWDTGQPNEPATPAAA